MNQTDLHTISQNFLNACNEVVLGQKDVIQKLGVAIFSGGHILIEGVPGLAKTSIAKLVSQLIDMDFKRISATPDLLPTDLIGVNMYNPQENNFTIHKGPIFTQILLVDEINRAPAKVQSALLECMQEKTATIGEETFQLDDSFFVIATQNPIDEEGIYVLPLAEKDRFMMKILIDYPDELHEADIFSIQNIDDEIKKQKSVMTQEELQNIKKHIQEMYVDDKILKYIQRLIKATRTLKAPDNHHTLFRIGASPRAAQYLLRASKALAFLNKSEYVLPDHIQAVWSDIMRHRLVVDYYADIKTVEQSLAYVLENVEIYG